MGSNEQQAILQYHPNQSLTGARISQKPSGQPALRRSISMTGMDGSGSEGNKGSKGSPLGMSRTGKHGDPLPRRELGAVVVGNVGPFRVGSGGVADML